MTKDEQIWIPTKDLQCRICVIAHSGCSGHKGIQPTIDAIKARFWWHCEVNKGVVIPRPWGEAVHAEARNQVLHYDFLYMGKSKHAEGFTYVLVLQDDFSLFRELVPAKAADHAVVVDALLNWFARYGPVKMTFSDQGTHFKNAVIEELHQRLKIKHHFTTAYAPWANGTVERANRDILFGMRALLSEFRLQPGDWPDLLPVVQYSLNFSTSRRLGGYSPATVFGLFDTVSPLDVVYCKRERRILNCSVPHEAVRGHFEQLRLSLESMHKCVAATTTKQREAERRRRAAKPNVKSISFEEGEYVLAARDMERNLGKLRTRWRGPLRIKKVVNKWIYEVEDLITKELKEVHASRLKHYADSDLNVDQELFDQCAHDGAGFEIDSFVNLRKRNGQWEIEVRWRGFESAADNTWEPLQSIIEDVPILVKRWMKTQKTQKVREAAKDLNFDISFLPGEEVLSEQPSDKGL